MNERAQPSDNGDAPSSDGGEPPRTLASLCASSAEAVGVTGAGILIMVGKTEQASVCHSDAVSALLEELQYTFGEGPSIDTHRLGRPVLASNLASVGEVRWPAFTSAAVEAGVRAVFAFPLHIGAARLGVLHVYRDRSGPLSDIEHDAAVTIAARLTHAVLDLQADAPPGSLARELGDSGLHRLEVHQASGMISAQLDVGVDEALVRLRAYAYATGRLLLDVARDVVARRLRLAGASRGGREAGQE